MATICVNPSRKINPKDNKKVGPSDRETRAFVALQSRKISRQNGLEKKRRVPPSSNENQAANDQIKNPKEREAINDPVREALKKWQKEKRLKEIKKKCTKKQPFCPVSKVSYKLSEFPHTYLNQDKMNSTIKKLKSKDHNSSSTTLPTLKVSQKKSSHAKDKYWHLGSNVNSDTTENKHETKRSCHKMKTRSMANKKTSLKKSNVNSIPMETDDVKKPRCLDVKQERKVVKGSNKEPINVKPWANVANQSDALPKTENVIMKVKNIPTDFTFTVPVGVKSFCYSGDKFQFTPLSPRSACKFFPTTTSHQDKSDDADLSELNKQTGSKSSNDETRVEMIDISCSKHLDNELSGKYFRDLAYSEMNRLKARSSCWKCEMDEGCMNLPEDVKGKIRAVIGQVQLLVTKKFKQFSGLLDLNEDTSAEKKALLSDLQGFWDMMYIQVQDIDKKFCELEELKENNWIEKQPAVKKIVKKSTKIKKAVNSNISNRKTAENRNKFREMRAKMKAKLDAEKSEDLDSFKIILTPVKNKKAVDSSEPAIILTPVRRSTRKSRGPVGISIPLINLAENVSVDLFGASRNTPKRIEKNEYISRLDDSMFGSCQLSPVVLHSTEDDLMAFSPKTPANIDIP